MLTDWVAMVITNSVLGSLRLHHLKPAAVPLKHFISSFLILPVCVYFSGKINGIYYSGNQPLLQPRLMQNLPPTNISRSDTVGSDITI